jgi:hypothetical protein
MIIAAAERGGCERIWSEDLNAAQKYFGIAVENPFGPTNSSREILLHRYLDNLPT